MGGCGLLPLWSWASDLRLGFRCGAGLPHDGEPAARHAGVQSPAGPAGRCPGRADRAGRRGSPGRCPGEEPAGREHRARRPADRPGHRATAALGGPASAAVAASSVAAVLLRAASIGQAHAGRAARGIRNSGSGSASPWVAYRRGQVLIVDESTAALDARAELEVFEKILAPAGQGRCPCRAVRAPGRAVHGEGTSAEARLNRLRGSSRRGGGSRLTPRRRRPARSPGTCPSRGP